MPILLCLSDLDETILNWKNTFADWLRLQTRFENIAPAETIVSLESWLNCDIATARNLIEEFNSTNCFYDLEPYEHALTYIPKLHNLGYKFIGITACEDCHDTLKARWANLSRYFPNMFIGLHCVGLGKNKFDYLNLYKPSIWVEDKIEHAKDGVRAGHKSYLINHPHNRGNVGSDVIRVNGWGEIYEDCKYLTIAKKDANAPYQDQIIPAYM